MFAVDEKIHRIIFGCKCNTNIHHIEVVRVYRPEKG